MDRKLFDAEGETLALGAALEAMGRADVVAFGELHGHPVGAEFELKLLKALAATDRPVALAMEFLERDTQTTVDSYLAGEIDLATFKKEARQSPAYDATHGPLIEFCKAEGIPVIAANSPRALVKAYRSQDLDYDEWVSDLTDEERENLPRATTTPDDAYKERFMAFMGPKRGPAFFKSQALWDDAMGEAITDFRDTHAEHRVLLVIGVFHVTGRLGTVTKIRHRRPDEQVYVMAMSMDGEPPVLDWSAGDEGIGDAILRVVPQPQRAHPRRAPKAKAPKQGDAQP